MKPLTLLFLFLSTVTTAQEYFNILENNTLIWQKVYESDINPAALLTALKQNGLQEIEQVSETEIHVFIKNQRPGQTGLKVPMFIIVNNVNAFAIIDFKDGKYRVTIKNIDLIQTTDLPDPLTKTGYIRPLTDYALKKKGGYTNTFIKWHKVYDDTFLDLFNIKREKENVGDW